MKSILGSIFLVLLIMDFSAIAGENMSLRGKGMMTYLGFIRVYDAALYTQHPDDIVNILDPEISKCLRLDYKVRLAPEDFIKGANAILKRQHNSDTLSRVENQIRSLHEAYRSVDEGDNYQLCYDGESKVTTLLLNSEQLIAIESSEFGNIYLGIWLGPREPIDERLRDNLLLGRN